MTIGGRYGRERRRAAAELKLVDSDAPDLGPCCACERSAPEVTVRNVLQLDQRAPVAGTGWGCFTCGLATDGAIAVLCDDCLEAKTPLRFVVSGWATAQGRADATAPVEPFGHIMERHREFPS